MLNSLSSTEHLFSFKNADDILTLRHVLQSSGFSSAGVLDRLGVKDFPSIRSGDLPLLLHRTNNGTPLDLFVRLFLIEVPVEAGALARAIEPMSLETWVDAGLVEVDAGAEMAVAAIKLLPYEDLLVAFDLPRRLQDSLKYEYVMGIGKSSLTLANLTVRRHSRATLDLGTGCGIQALLAAGHSDRVFAVDRNPRAIRFASFNAKLNGMTNIECIEGDLFEPVEGEKLDLVVSNPPFVISPEMRYIYRDSGMQGDQVCRKIVREVPRFLQEGGYCQILCNWAEYTQPDAGKELAGWFEETGCDAWVMRSETLDAAAYASTWIQHTEKDEPERFSQRFEEWLAYYEQLGIGSVSAGLITMRRSRGRKNWLRSDDTPEKMLGPCGQSVLRGFELHDFLEIVEDDLSLLDSCFLISPEVRLEQEYEPRADGWKLMAGRMRLTRGLAWSGEIDPFMANMLIGCNGQRRLGDLLGNMAAFLRVALPAVTAPFCELVRKLVERGFLLPSGLEHQVSVNPSTDRQEEQAP